jgi:hypothetical protein
VGVSLWDGEIEVDLLIIVASEGRLCVGPLCFPLRCPYSIRGQLGFSPFAALVARHFDVRWNSRADSPLSFPLHGDLGDFCMTFLHKHGVM